SVYELEMLVPGFYLVPNPPHPEITLSDIDVVQQDHSGCAHFWKPRLEIMFYSFVRVIPIDVKQVDGPVAKVFQRLVKCALDKPGETLVEKRIVSAQFRQDFRSIESGVTISLPGINRITMRIKTQLLYGLAKSA